MAIQEPLAGLSRQDIAKLKALLAWHHQHKGRLEQDQLRRWFPVTSAGGVGQKIRWAFREKHGEYPKYYLAGNLGYLGSAGGLHQNMIHACLDTPETGEQIIVYFDMVGSSAVQDLSYTSMYFLSEYAPMPVAKKSDGKWWYVGHATEGVIRRAVPDALPSTGTTLACHLDDGDGPVVTVNFAMLGLSDPLNLSASTMKDLTSLSEVLMITHRFDAWWYAGGIVNDAGPC